MEMSPETIKALLDAFDEATGARWSSTVGEDRLHVSRDPLPEGRCLAAGSAPPAPAAARRGSCRRRGPTIPAGS